MLAFIASSGAAELGARLGLEPAEVLTEWGPVTVRRGEVSDLQVVCVARHGEGQPLPPHAVNYRANIAALADLGCTAILATNAVGSLRPDIRPPALCLPHQLLDFTASRPRSFHDDRMVAVDFTTPYCRRLSALIAEAVSEVGEQVHRDLVYACMEGPRFETAAEIRMLQLLGADLVGMTAMPEAVLAREKGLCYASLCVVTNLAAGIEGHHPSSAEVTSTMEARWQLVEQVLRIVASKYADDPACPCHHAAE